MANRKSTCGRHGRSWTEDSHPAMYLIVFHVICLACWSVTRLPRIWSRHLACGERCMQQGRRANIGQISSNPGPMAGRIHCHRPGPGWKNRCERGLHGFRFAYFGCRVSVRREGARIITFRQTPVTRPIEWRMLAGDMQLLETYSKGTSREHTDIARIRQLDGQNLVTVEVVQGDSTIITYRRL